MMRNFDPNLCFVHEINKLTKQLPNVIGQENRSFSLLLAYCYNIIKYHPHTVIIPDNYEYIIRELFPEEFISIIKQSEAKLIDDSESDEESSDISKTGNKLIDELLNK